MDSYSFQKKKRKKERKKEKEGQKDIANRYSVKTE